MDEVNVQSSEWNEQLNFAMSFFSSKRRTEIAKESGNPVNWWAQMENKLTYACVLNKKNEELIKSFLRERTAIQKLIETAQSSPKANRSKVLTDLHNALFLMDLKIEASVDNVMPFTKVAKKFDIDEEI
jgi:hypothetical protein